jgi:ADP-L-glycero-D-manno-heptose 6-epimerase
MVIVTGGAGFIGSNLVKQLNLRGINDILVIDNLTNGRKFTNLSGLDFVDYIDKDDFLECLCKKDFYPNIDAIFHQGACSNTIEWNGRYMMDTNYSYSKHLLNKCLELSIPFIYASSASVYGNNPVSIESREHEKPLNMYAFSKFQFDQYVRTIMPQKSQIVGLRYFNVYGPGEAHKESMASVMWHFHKQLMASNTISLFKGYSGYKDGEQLRDFIYVEDVVNVILWIYDNPQISGIYNLGTGEAKSFNDVANSMITFYGHGRIQYIPLPLHLNGVYQSYTQANMTKLIEKGYDNDFTQLQIGIERYMRFLDL